MPDDRTSAVTASDPRWISVARLLRPQGRRGELLADPLSDMMEIFAPGKEFRLLPATRSTTPLTVTLENAWQPQGRKAGRLVVKLAGYDSISAAEQLEGAEFQMDEAALPSLADDTFLVRDLLGCTLWDGEHELGTVIDLQFPIAADGRTRLADAPDLLVIQPLAPKASSKVEDVAAFSTSDVPAPNGLEPDEEDAESILVPFVKAWLDEVDLPGKRLRMHLPPGLFE